MQSIWSSSEFSPPTFLITISQLLESILLAQHISLPLLIHHFSLIKELLTATCSPLAEHHKEVLVQILPPPHILVDRPFVELEDKLHQLWSDLQQAVSAENAPRCDNSTIEIRLKIQLQMEKESSGMLCTLHTKTVLFCKSAGDSS